MSEKSSTERYLALQQNFPLHLNHLADFDMQLLLVRFKYGLSHSYIFFISKSINKKYRNNGFFQKYNKKCIH